MAEPHTHELGAFSLGTPAHVCRWRLAGRSLLLANRHLRAFARRIVNDKPVSPELVAWAKQHIEWTLADGSHEHPDGVLMLIIDDAGAAAMTVGPYLPLAHSTARHLIGRACSAAREQEQTDVAPEVLFVHTDGALYAAAAPDAGLGGCANLVVQLASTLGIPVTFESDLLDDLMEGSLEADGIFLASDEHGIVPASDCSNGVSERFAASYRRLFESARSKAR